VWISLHSADVTVSNQSAPAMSGPAWPLWTGGYHQGRKESASFGGADNTGISEAHPRGRVVDVQASA
jgi:hypothetical protein